MRYILGLWLGVMVLGACESAINQDPIPQVLVNEQLNLNSLQNQALQLIGGYKILPEAGYKGLIIYRASTTEYRAFDLACSYQPTSDCAQVMVDDSDLFMVDTCCNSSFDFNGFPTGGPAQWPLQPYPVYLNGDVLTIQN